MRNIIIGITAAVFFWLVFLNGPIGRMNLPVAHHDDMEYYYFLVGHDLEKISNLDVNNFFDTRMYYPMKNTLALGDTMLVQAIWALPVFVLTRNVILAGNFATLFSFLLTYLFSYLLIYRLTKSRTGAVIAALIYTYNPFVMSHYQRQAELTELEFIPLAFLAAERWLTNKDLKSGILLAVTLVCQVVGSFYYAFFLGLLLPIYLFLRAKFLHIDWKSFLSIKLVAPLFLAVVVSWLFLQPFNEAKKGLSMSRTETEIERFSAEPADFFFPAAENRYFGWMVTDPLLSTLRPDYIKDHYTEHSLLPGFTAWVFFIAGLWLFWKKRFEKDERALFIAGLAVVGIAVYLSLGTRVNIFSVNLPTGYWVLYKLLPIIEPLRAISRFMAVGYIGLAIIIGLVWKFLEGKKLVTWRHFLIVMLIMIIEYLTISRPAGVIPDEINKLNTWLKNDRESRVILQLPIANDLAINSQLSRDPADDAQYLLYSLYHSKKLVNGYTGFIPPERLQLGNYLTLNFPTEEKLVQLRKSGVDLVIIHLEEYFDIGQNVKEGNNLANQLQKLSGSPVYASENIKVYRL